MKSRAPKKGAVSRRIDKAQPVHDQIAREKARHGRKVTTLLEQTTASGRISDPGQRDLALVRLRGLRVEEDGRHSDKLAALDERLRRIWD